MLAVSQKRGDCRNTDKAAHLHWSLVRNYTACPEMLFDKDSMTKRHMNLHADLSENQGRMHKQWDWSAYTSVTCDQWNASQIILKKKI